MVEAGVEAGVEAKAGVAAGGEAGVKVEVEVDAEVEVEVVCGSAGLFPNFRSFSRLVLLFLFAFFVRSNRAEIQSNLGNPTNPALWRAGAWPGSGHAPARVRPPPAGRA